MRRVIFNQKGGVGKSTITCNLAAISAVEGKKTLVIDLDVQGNSTQYLLGSKVADSDKTIAHFFKDSLGLGLFGGGKEGLDGLIHETPFPNLYVLPSHSDLEACKAGWNPGIKSTNCAKRWNGWKLRTHLYRHAADSELLQPVSLDRRRKMPDPVRLRHLRPRSVVHADACDHRSQGRPQPAFGSGSVVVNQYQKQANLPRQLVEDLIAEACRCWKPKSRPRSKSANRTATPNRWCTTLHRTN